MLYFDGTEWHLLKPGTYGQFLQTPGPTGVPAWADIAEARTRVSGSLSVTNPVIITVPGAASHGIPSLLEMNMALSDGGSSQSVYFRVLLSAAQAVLESTFSIDGLGTFFDPAVLPSFVNVGGDLKISVQINVTVNPVTYRISALEA